MYRRNNSQWKQESWGLRGVGALRYYVIKESNGVFYLMRAGFIFGGPRAGEGTLRTVAQGSLQEMKNRAIQEIKAKKNPAMRRNVSDQRKALREKYRKKHGDDWWKKDSIKAKFDAELKKTPKGGFTRDGKTIAEPAASKSRGRGKKPFASKEIVDEFIDYAYGFYGRGGVHGMNTTKTQLRAATKEYIKALQDKNADYHYLVDKAYSKMPKFFDGDTTDRENVAIIVEDMYGKKKPSERFSGKKPSSRGRGKKRKEKTIKKKFYSESFYDKVDIAIQKKLAPIVDKGVSEMIAIDAEEVGWAVGYFATLELSDNKDIWFLQMKGNVNLPSGGIKAVSKSIDYDATPTKIANEAVKLYKRYINKYGGEKSSSATSYSGDRISLNMLKGAGLKRLAQAVGTFLPIIKGHVEVKQVHEDGAHIILGTSKYHLVFEVDPKNKNSITLDIQADNEDMIEFIGIKSSASLASMQAMVYDVLNTAHDFDGGKLLKRGFANKTLKQLQSGNKKSSSRSFSGKNSYMDKVDIAIEKHFSPVVKKGVSEMQAIDSDIYQWSVGDEGMLELVLIKDSVAIELDLNKGRSKNKKIEVAVKKKAMTPTQLAKQIAAYYKELTGKSSSKKSSSRKSSAKKSAPKKRAASRGKASKPHFKIGRKKGKFMWELVIGGDIATRSGYKSKATAKKAFMKAVSENADVLEERGVDSYELFCNVRDL